MNEKKKLFNEVIEIVDKVFEFYLSHLKRAIGQCGLRQQRSKMFQYEKAMEKYDKIKRGIKKELSIKWGVKCGENERN